MLGLVPALLAGMAAVASPAPALAATSVVENGTTTYVVNTAKSEIDVTIKLSIKNNDSEYYYATAIDVEVQAGAVKATSNAGPVQAATRRADAGPASRRVSNTRTERLRREASDPLHRTRSGLARAVPRPTTSRGNPLRPGAAQPTARV